MPFHFCTSTTSQLASSSLGGLLVEDQFPSPPQTPIYILSPCYCSLLPLISSSVLAFICFIHVAFNSGWLWPDTLHSGSLFSKRRIRKNRDCNALFAGLGGGVEEQEENSLATILVRAISDEAVQFSQALRGCTNLTR